MSLNCGWRVQNRESSMSGVLKPRLPAVDIWVFGIIKRQQTTQRSAAGSNAGANIEHTVSDRQVRGHGYTWVYSYTSYMKDNALYKLLKHMLGIIKRMQNYKQTINQSSRNIHVVRIWTWSS